MIKKGRMKISIGVLCCLFVLNVIPIVHANTDHFTNSVAIIIGKCNTVTTPAYWLFGCKLMYNKEVTIQANGGPEEKITALILPSKIGFYFGHNNIGIQLEGAKGFFFWGEKSLFFQNVPPRIFAFCKASDILVTYE
ncbi:MAG TPA: hypothetical protein DSN98_04670 [Thermoplasmata archaeon]|jgi:hypothetical protein|nr:MAG TPA: hypothetical protein DSN98_04670 [Thermoplasmata archaeon]